MSDQYQYTDVASGRGSGKQGNEQKVLHSVSKVPAVRHWSVDPHSKRFLEEIKMLRILPQDTASRELVWFEQFEYARAVLQVHVEQALDKPGKERKEIYKRWRADLGDDQARRYAKFTEYVQKNERPKWFKKELTLFPDTIVLKPSSVLTELPVSLSPSQRKALAMQPSLL